MLGEACRSVGASLPLDHGRKEMKGERKEGEMRRLLRNLTFFLLLPETLSFSFIGRSKAQRKVKAEAQTTTKLPNGYVRKTQLSEKE